MTVYAAELRLAHRPGALTLLASRAATATETNTTVGTGSRVEPGQWMCEPPLMS